MIYRFKNGDINKTSSQYDEILNICYKKGEKYVSK